MEIERKYLVGSLPYKLDQYPHEHIIQAYVWTKPVIRVRKKSAGPAREQYILTIKGGGMMAREEIEMPIDEQAFSGLYEKREGIAIDKIRYRIPDGQGYTIELDVFKGVYEGFVMAEVEFPDIESADAYCPPEWFGEEVTMDKRFHNSTLSTNTMEEVRKFMDLFYVTEI